MREPDEIRPDPESRRQDFWRRLTGVFFISVALLMVIVGLTSRLEERLSGPNYIFYWLVCLVFTASAMMVALVDLRVVRFRAREAQKTLIRKTFGAPESGKHSKE